MPICSCPAPLQLQNSLQQLRVASLGHVGSPGVGFAVDLVVVAAATIAGELEDAQRRWVRAEGNRHAHVDGPRAQLLDEHEEPSSIPRHHRDLDEELNGRGNDEKQEDPTEEFVGLMLPVELPGLQGGWRISDLPVDHLQIEVHRNNDHQVAQRVQDVTAQHVATARRRCRARNLEDPKVKGDHRDALGKAHLVDVQTAPDELPTERNQQEHHELQDRLDLLQQLPAYSAERGIRTGLRDLLPVTPLQQHYNALEQQHG
mmetsp:Transcript_52058/g.121025  ORF Transcript_52058/g.121025 Transcript_52058/m.121025 type:complete len:259 (+) Transcript_52058:66-842(+)